MKSLRFLVLLMAVAVVPMLSVRAHAQQEVDPEHFDQATAAITASKSHNPKAAAVRRHSQAHAKMASRHKVHHRSLRASG